MSDEPEDDEYAPEWYPYEAGATVNEVGPAGGIVRRDEEYGDPEDEEDADARVTLEQGRAADPGWFVTGTLYGWLFHTHRAADEAAAVAAYDAMKAELSRLTDLLPYEEDRDVAAKAQRLADEVAAFEARFA